MEEIKQASIEEFDGLMEFLARAYGSSVGILSLALNLIKEKGLECIRIARPYEDNDINRRLLDASSSWSVEPLCSILKGGIMICRY